MNYHTKFQDQEWNVILTLPIWISGLIRDVTVDPVSIDRLSDKFLKLLPETDDFDSSLTKAVFADLNQGLTSMTFQPDSRNPNEGFEVATSIMGRKIPDEVAEAFKKDLMLFAITLERAVEPSEKHAQEFSKQLVMAMAMW